MMVARLLVGLVVRGLVVRGQPVVRVGLVVPVLGRGR